MEKKKSWFTYVKRLFIPESKPRSEVTTQKLKKWRWIFKSFKFRQYPELKAPQEALNEATEEQRKHAMVVAIATTAAAEAAVAAANAAAKVVRLTNIPHEIERKNQYLAAVKIQSAYRGHLARKALSALKGLVKLQAAIRGELVRSSVVKTQPSMSLISSTRSQVQTKRVPTLLDYIYHGEKRHSLGLKEGSKSEELRHRGNIHRNWDLSLVSKEEMEALYLQKQEAIAKQDRMRQYSFSQQERRNNRRLQESMNHKENRKSSRFDQFVEVHQHKDKEKLKHLIHPNTIAVDAIQLSQMKQITAHKQQRVEELDSSSSLPRRSFCHVKQKSIGEDRALLNSPAFPTYMAATKSAKAKSRSLSTPKQRLRLCDTHSGELSPYMLKLSTCSSLSGEITSSSERNSISQHTPSSFGTLIRD